MKRKTSKALGSWILVNNIIIVAIAVAASIFVQVQASISGNGDISDGILKSLGIIIPMCVLITVYNVFIFRSGYRHVKLMNESIEKIANGDFAVRIEKKGARSMTDVYENINKMAEELQTMAIMKNDFINSYSHEFKTPIASINGFAELLLRTDVDEEHKKMYLQVIFDESSRLANLTNSTILLTKLDNQTIIENKTSYSLDEQLRQCSIALSRSWTEKGITISGEIENINYFGNEELMKQVWLNLLNNAIKFTPNGGEIFVTLKEENQQIVVSIRDSGKGMSEEQASHIFDKFYQVDKSGQNAGLGLGLSIVKRIIDLSGGTIEVQSKLNVGSTFIVKLPK